MDNLQELLDMHANLSNSLSEVKKQIVEMRGNDPPCCWGHDDCSTQMLMHCPWRIDCGDKL